MAERRRRWPTLAVAFLMVGALVAALVIDVQVHGMARHERDILTQARRQLSASDFDLAATTYARALAVGNRNALQASVASMLSQVATTQGVLGTTDQAASTQSLDISTLQTCLGGVRGALRQIAAHDNSVAIGDISAVSSACLTAEGSAPGGPVYPFDFPDPDVVRVYGTYFAYATNSAEGNIQIIDSTDLIHWAAVGNALPSLPKWAVPGGTWAPAVVQVGSTFVLYYAAQVAGAGSGDECISVATASEPQGPFTDNSTAPLECQPALGGSIDPSPFVDANGTLYLQWKSIGAGGQPATIWSEQLNASGTGFAARTTPTALLSADLGWEAGVVEAPDLVLDAGRYFLFYSGNNWDSSSYAVGVATCSGPLGPCTEPLTQPILASGPGMAGPGGESVFTDASGSFWIAFDAWLPGAVSYPNSRALYLRPLDLSGATPVVGPAG